MLMRLRTATWTEAKVRGGNCRKILPPGRREATVKPAGFWWMASGISSWCCEVRKPELQSVGGARTHPHDRCSILLGLRLRAGDGGSLPRARGYVWLLDHGTPRGALCGRRAIPRSGSDRESLIRTGRHLRLNRQAAGQSPPRYPLIATPTSGTGWQAIRGEAACPGSAQAHLGSLSTRVRECPLRRSRLPLRRTFRRSFTPIQKSCRFRLAPAWTMQISWIPDMSDTKPRGAFGN